MEIEIVDSKSETALDIGSVTAQEVAVLPNDSRGEERITIRKGFKHWLVILSVQLCILLYAMDFVSAIFCLFALLLKLLD